ncbi:MAG: metallophosphoesterase [Clostridia bacterium]|nr:metallophosphoesterase [Clostridia bacterium]
MKRLIIVSDTHGNVKGVEKLLPLIKENHYFLHLGDGIRDLAPALEVASKKTYFCKGNCDFIGSVPEDGILEIEGVRIYYCHGHQYGVKQSLLSLALATKSRGCTVALYGHTHLPAIDEWEGVTLINPGSMKFSAGEGGSYCYLVVNGEKITPVIVGENGY